MEIAIEQLILVNMLRSKKSRIVVYEDDVADITDTAVRQHHRGKAAKLQSCKAAKLQSCKAAKLQSCKAAASRTGAYPHH
jgi:dihydroxyacetone kinase